MADLLLGRWGGGESGLSRKEEKGQSSYAPLGQLKPTRSRKIADAEPYGKIAVHLSTFDVSFKEI